jgi:hypothetical protein
MDHDFFTEKSQGRVALAIRNRNTGARRAMVEVTLARPEKAGLGPPPNRTGTAPNVQFSVPGPSRIENPMREGFREANPM